jgi:hypothetical protein
MHTMRRRRSVVQLEVAVSPTAHPPIHRAFRNTERVSNIGDGPALLEHTSDQQAALNRGELGVTVQFQRVLLGGRRLQHPQSSRRPVLTNVIRNYS